MKVSSGRNTIWSAFTRPTLRANHSKHYHSSIFSLRINQLLSRSLSRNDPPRFSGTSIPQNTQTEEASFPIELHSISVTPDTGAFPRTFSHNPRKTEAYPYLWSIVYPHSAARPHPALSPIPPPPTLLLSLSGPPHTRKLSGNRPPTRRGPELRRSAQTALQSLKWSSPQTSRRSCRHFHHPRSRRRNWARKRPP